MESGSIEYDTPGGGKNIVSGWKRGMINPNVLHMTKQYHSEKEHTAI